jgi:isopentenyl diphosphate isomerase/L-lactate dehydrogenase-like FMN-dependent dehydrogenase
MSQPSSASFGIEHQLAIYKKGLFGTRPAQPVAVEALEAAAAKALKPEPFAYLAGGAGGEDTQRANREAFYRWRIVPRFLRNVAVRDLSVEVLGQRLRVPFLLAPIGVQEIFHKHGELASARAAKACGVPFILSTVSSHSIEEVAEEMGDAPRWFQLYWPKDPNLAASFVRRAEQSGYSAIVVTLDTYLLSWRERDIQNAYLPFLGGLGLANYFTDPVFQEAIGGSPKLHPIKAVQHFAEVFSNAALTWSDLAFLRQHTRLPIILKGVLHPDDARKAVEHGANGIIVSNHGGRQLDGAVAALDALPGVVAAVGGQTTILFDSGIRRGADIFKALALGARAVLLGRPYCYGLAVNGEEGVCDVIKNLIADFDLTLGLAGCASLHDVKRDRLVDSNNPTALLSGA